MYSFLKSSVTLLVTLSFGTALLSAQEPNQQRPRRVTGQTEQSATATTKPGPSAPQEVEEGDVVRVDTQLVSVPAIVTSAGGRPLAGLRTENFVLFEN